MIRRDVEKSLRNMFERGYKQGYENALKENALKKNKGEWIPVSERLPEKNVWVLVTVEQNEMRYQEIMRRNNYKEGWTDNIDIYTDEITAWQPLPEPYKADVMKTIDDAINDYAAGKGW